jgi:hypothetical protein
MQLGDDLIYIAQPLLYGPMTLHHVTSRGQLIVELANGNRESFTPHELETAEVWLKQQAAA